MNTKLFITLIFLTVATSSIFAQKKNSYGNQQWFQYYNQTKLNDKWTVLTDAGFRFRNNLSENAQYIVRAGVGYNFTPDTRVAVGFATSGFYNNTGSISRIEYRPHQEFSINGKLAKTKTQLRFRVEERFFTNTITNAKSFNFRFRQYFMTSTPILNFSEEKKDKILYFNLGNEIFLNQGKEIIYNTFDQNRFLIGPELQFSKNLSVSFIYNYQFQGLNVAASYRNEDIIWISVRHKLDLQKKEVKE